MQEVDWAVWPLFFLQALILLIMLLPFKARKGGISLRSLAVVLLIVVCIAIAVSLYHDSTDVLKLYF